jgi:hypothetical protein
MTPAGASAGLRDSQDETVCTPANEYAVQDGNGDDRSH